MGGNQSTRKLTIWAWLLVVVLLSGACTAGSAPAMPVEPTAATTGTPLPQLQFNDVDYAPWTHVADFGRRDDPDQLHLAGALLATPRGELIVADNGNDRWQRFGLDGTLLETVSAPDTYASAIAFLSNGNVALANRRDNVVEIRTPAGRLLKRYAQWPEPEGGYQTDSDHIAMLAVGLEDEIYIGEKHGKRVVILNADGFVREVWYGPPDNPLRDIRDIATDGAGNLYVTALSQNRIVRRAPDGAVEEFSFEGPTQIAPGTDGSFYVASETKHLAFYDARGNQISRWRNEELLVCDLAVATDGTLVALDVTSTIDQDAVIFRYDEAGAELSRFATTALRLGQFQTHAAFSVSPAGDIWLLDTGTNPGSISFTALVHIDGEDHHLNTFSRLDGRRFVCDTYVLAALSDRTVLVSDPCAGAIMHVSAAGALLNRWGERGTGPGRFNLIVDLDVAPDEQSFYVTDGGNNRLVQMDLTGRIVNEWESAALGVADPAALAVTAGGTFVMLDAATEEIVVWSPAGESRRWRFPVSNERPHSIAADSNGGFIYVGGSRFNVYVFGWDGTLLGRVPRGSSHPTLVEIGPGGLLYASTSYNRIRVYEPPD